MAGVLFLTRRGRAHAIIPAGKPPITAPFYLLKPEVAGGWGPNTVAQRHTHPPIVTHLHYEFEGWLGDDLLETFPEFIVTEDLARALEQSRLTGFGLAPVETSAGGMWERYVGADARAPSGAPMPLAQDYGSGGDGRFRSNPAGKSGGVSNSTGLPAWLFADSVRGPAVERLA